MAPLNRRSLLMVSPGYRRRDLRIDLERLRLSPPPQTFTPAARALDRFWVLPVLLSSSWPLVRVIVKAPC